MDQFYLYQKLQELRTLFPKDYREEQTTVYHEELGSMSEEKLDFAVKWIKNNRTSGTFPKIADIREAAGYYRNDGVRTDPVYEAEKAKLQKASKLELAEYAVENPESCLDGLEYRKALVAYKEGRRARPKRMEFMGLSEKTLEFFREIIYEESEFPF